MVSSPAKNNSCPYWGAFKRSSSCSECNICLTVQLCDERTRLFRAHPVLRKYLSENKHYVTLRRNLHVSLKRRRPSSSWSPGQVAFRLTKDEQANTLLRVNADPL